jgi:hypothetical protein
MSEQSSADDNDDLARRRQLFDTLSAQARTYQQASSDSFDNQLLTYSSALLGLSLSFIKDIVPLNIAIWIPCLYASWILLALCILCTIASFRFGIEAQKKHGDYLYKYYIDKEQAYFNKKSKWSTAVTVCAYIGAATFFLAVILTISFAVKNISNLRTHARYERSEAKQKDALGSAPTSKDDRNERRAANSTDDPDQRRAEGQVTCKHDSCCTNCESCTSGSQQHRKGQASKPKVTPREEEGTL